MGTFCPVGSGLPTPCFPGSASEFVNASSCDTCSEGSYQDVDGATSCLECPAGFFCPNASSVPTRTPVGRLILRHIHARPHRLPISPHISPDLPMLALGWSSCSLAHPKRLPLESPCSTACPGGTYMPFNGSTSETQCSPVSAGYYAPLGPSPTISYHLPPSPSSPSSPTISTISSHHLPPSPTAGE